MGSEWQEKSFGELFSVKHGFAFKGQHFVDEPTRHLLTTPGNFAIGGGFQNPKPKFYDGPVPEDYVLQAGDVVVTMTDLSKASDTLGNAALIPNDENVWLHNQRVGLLEFHDIEAVDPQFICYLLRLNEYRSWIIGSATGTTVKHTSPSRIEEFSCPVPPLPEQQAIAHILGTLDDKIELNRRMNATLEGMAQALFKSWFVDFDPVLDNAILAGNPIPEEFAERAKVRRAILEQNQNDECSMMNDELKDSSIHHSSLKTHHSPQAPSLAAGNPIPDELAPRAEVRKNALASGTTQQGFLDHPTLSDPKSLFPTAFQFTEELGWIPEGWEAVKLQSVCDRIFSGGTPRTKESAYWNAGIPWLSSGETGQRFILETEKTISQDGVKNSSTRQTRKGAVVIASAGQGKTRGQTSCLCFDSYINQSVIALEADNSAIPDSFLFFDLARRYEEFRQISDAHSSRGSLTTKLLAEIDVVVPKGQPLSDFGTIAGDAIRKITANARQTSELSKLRDTLLPKLISGELRLPEVEPLTEGVLA